MNNIERYYKILNIDSAASLDTVRQAYLTLAKIWHPDLYINDPNQKALAEREIKKINQAYEAIKSYLEFRQSLSRTINPNAQSQVSKENTPDFYYFQGVDYAEQQNYEDVLISFAQAVKLDSNYIKAYQYRGFIFSELGYENRANAEFEKVNQITAKKKKNKAYCCDKTKSKTHPTSRESVKTRIIKCYKSILDTNKPITSIVVSSDNKTFISINKDENITLWNVDIGKKIAILRGHTDIVNSVVIDNRGETLISCGRDKK